MFRGNCDGDCYFLTSPGCNDCRECAYCGSMLYHNGNRQNIHFDHIMAEINGGRTKVPACALCNQSKHDKPLRGWLRRITQTRPTLFRKVVEYHLYKKIRSLRQLEWFVKNFMENNCLKIKLSVQKF